MEEIELWEKEEAAKGTLTGEKATGPGDKKRMRLPLLN
jgi:hypothetical protein